MKPLLKTLPPETIETLIALCDEHSYLEAARLALENLGLKISPGSLCNLYTRHRITHASETRADYLADSPVGAAGLLSVTEEQLQLRLLEAAARSNLSPTELRAVCEILARFRSLDLAARRAAVAERRVTLAEKRDTRENTPSIPQPSLPPREVMRRVKALLGKPIPPELEDDATQPLHQSHARFNPQPTDPTRRHPSNEH